MFVQHEEHVLQFQRMTNMALSLLMMQMVEDCNTNNLLLSSVLPAGACEDPALDMISELSEELQKAPLYIHGASHSWVQALLPHQIASLYPTTYTRFCKSSSNRCSYKDWCIPRHYGFCDFDKS